MNERILLNFLLSLAPIFGYQLAMLYGQYERNSKAAQTLIGVLSGVSIVLCMTFPITSGEHFVWDMRWVSFIIAAIYGGFRGGVISSVVMLGYRAILGGGFLAWFVVLLDVIVLLPLVWKTGKAIQNKPLRLRLGIVSIVALASYVYIELSIFAYFSYLGRPGFFLQHGGMFFAWFGIATVAGCVICIALVESIFYQVGMRKQLEESEKVHLVGELAASFAHEIRNPLTVAKGFVQLLGESVDDRLKTYSNLAESELDRAEGIISDYLNFAKPQMKTFERINVDDALHDLVQIMTPYAVSHNAELICKFTSGIFIDADVYQFKQVLMNIMKNAIESLQGSGRVALETAQERNTLRISVKDTGVGMSPDQLRRLGKPFYSTKAKGTGLGMMITFRLVREMGGELHFESRLGTGTEAVILLPVMIESLRISKGEVQVSRS